MSIRARCVVRYISNLFYVMGIILRCSVSIWSALVLDRLLGAHGGGGGCRVPRFSPARADASHVAVATSR